jgi:hypothetical protein
MPECARCGDFTDNPAEDQYHYCDRCLDDFEEVKQNGVVIESLGPNNGYRIIPPASADSASGEESNQIDALARGKKVAEEIGEDCLFKYGGTGSQWLVDEYLQSHPEIRAKVQDRLSRVPKSSSTGMLTRLRNLLS